MSIPYKALEDPEYRHEYINSLTDGTLAAQVRVLREKRDLTQKQLADKASMQQSRISALENINYSSWSIRTLRRLAKVFDVAVVVRFESFGKALHELGAMNPDSLATPSFSDDPVRRETERTTPVGVSPNSLATPVMADMFAAGPDTSDRIRPSGRRIDVSRPRGAYLSVARPSITTAGHS